MEIRRYKLGEEDAIWGVYFAATHESVARDYHPDLVERWAPPNQDMKAWGERLAQKNPFIAIVDGLMLGEPLYGGRKGRSWSFLDSKGAPASYRIGPWYSVLFWVQARLVDSHEAATPRRQQSCDGCRA